MKEVSSDKRVMTCSKRANNEGASGCEEMLQLNLTQEKKGKKILIDVILKKKKKEVIHDELKK